MAVVLRERVGDQHYRHELVLGADPKEAVVKALKFSKKFFKYDGADSFEKRIVFVRTPLLRDGLRAQENLAYVATIQKIVQKAFKEVNPGPYLEERVTFYGKVEAGEWCIGIALSFSIAEDTEVPSKSIIATSGAFLPTRIESLLSQLS